MCRWRLNLLRREVTPGLLVAMGATATDMLSTSNANLLARRGTVETTTDGGRVLITLHPIFILPLPDRSAQLRAKAHLIKRSVAGRAVSPKSKLGNDKERVEAEAFSRLKAELTHAFAAPEETYKPLSAAEVIARNHG